MKRLAPFLLFLLAALLLLPSSSGAAVNKNKADRVMANKVLSNYGQVRSTVAKIRVSQETVDEVLLSIECAEDIDAGIGQSSMSDEEKFGYSLTNLIVLIYDIYFTTAASEKNALQKQEAALTRKTERLLKKAKSRASKRMVRSLGAQGAALRLFATVEIDIDVCRIRDRIVELGGYSSENVDLAFTEEVIDTGLIQFLESKKVTAVDEQLIKGYNEMQRIRPRLNAKRMENYSSGLMAVIVDSMGAFKQGVLGEKLERKMESVRLSAPLG